MIQDHTLTIRGTSPGHVRNFRLHPETKSIVHVLLARNVSWQNDSGQKTFLSRYRALKNQLPATFRQDHMPGISHACILIFYILKLICRHQEASTFAMAASSGSIRGQI